METVIRNVGDIAATDRQALEKVLGQRLDEDQQLVIHVVKRPMPPKSSAISQGHDGATLPEWCNVYAGLSDDEIAELEKTILTRADFTRSAE